MKRIAVIGGGISGLAAAHRAAELDPSATICLLEASGRLGGILQTIRERGYLIETSADSFITNVPWAIDLCRRIGFEDQLIPTDPAHRGAMVVAHGRLENVPEGFLLMAPNRVGSVLRSPVLSVRGKLRLACEWFVAARRDGGDESLASFARRRLGREAFERLVQPLVGGIYTADPERLSLAATLPRFLEMERQHGGLIRAARATKRRMSASNGGRNGAGNDAGRGATNSADTGDERGARYSMFVTPREGLSSLVDAIARRLPPDCVRLNTAVERLVRAGDRWRVEVRDARQPDATSSAGEFDGVVLATSSAVSAKLLFGVDTDLANELRGIEQAGSAIVVLGYDRQQIAHPLNTFGFVVPTIERRRILSASFSSVKFPGRAPAGKALFRVFLGGALQPEMVDRCDDELIATSCAELGELLGIRGEPELTKIFRWHGAMPQYHLGHLERLRRIDERLKPLAGLALAGNAFTGVGIPQCVHRGELAAERVLGETPTHEQSW